MTGNCQMWHPLPLIEQKREGQPIKGTTPLCLAFEGGLYLVYVAFAFPLQWEGTLMLGSPVSAAWSSQQVELWDLRGRWEGLQELLDLEAIPGGNSNPCELVR